MASSFDDLTRRDALVIAAGAAVATSLQAQAPPRFLTADEFRLVDELTEIIIPSDEHSPGARAAKVAAYIDVQLAEDLDDGPRQLWRNGLKRVVADVSTLAALEAADDPFFKDLKARTVWAYYTSRIGIQEEMEYKG